MDLQKGINVLSLCDGMSSGQIAMRELNISVNNYYSFEIKKSAIYVTQLNFPKTVQCGDVNRFDISILNDNKIDLFLCGSPCQNMSFINKSTRTGLKGNKSSLFFKCVEILKIVKPKYFLFENIASMKNRDKKIFTDILGVEPININSSLVSAQRRSRLYWTNIPNVTQPDDKNIKLSDIIEWGTDKAEEKFSDKKLNYISKRSANGIYAHIGGEKSMPITARGYSAWNTQYIIDNGRLRDLTTTEYRRLQTIPEWYSFGNLSKAKITNLIGDGWTIDVIKHILKRLKKVR